MYFYWLLNDSKKSAIEKEIKLKLETICSLDKLIKNSTENTLIYDWVDLVTTILNHNDPVFAKSIIDQLISTIKLNIDLDYTSLAPVFRILIKNYFDLSWNKLWNILNSKDIMSRIILKGIFIHDYELKSRKTILSEIPDNKFENILVSHNKAPEILSSLIEVYEIKNNKIIINSKVKILLEKFGNNNKILNNISKMIMPFAMWGSSIPYLKKEIKIYEKIIEKIQNIDIKNWAKIKIEGLKKVIKKEKISDEEDELNL